MTLRPCPVCSCLVLNVPDNVLRFGACSWLCVYLEWYYRQHGEEWPKHASADQMNEAMRWIETEQSVPVQGELFK